MIYNEIATGPYQMIIKRFAHAIREQSWFTVVLEIIIVVIGIFVGLQVDDWNQRRIERKNDQRAVALFVDELQLMLDEAGVDVQLVTEFLQDLVSGTEIALKCDASDEERARLITAIGNTLNWRVPDVRPAGLAEIGNSGTLARIGNPGLTRVVGTINQSIKGIDDSMDLMAPQYDRAWQMLLPYLVLTNPIKLEKLELGVARQTPPEYLSLLPQETLCSSQEFLLGLSLLTAFYESSVYSFEEWHSALSTAYELAKAETG
jgi:hypothetical protein